MRPSRDDKINERVDYPPVFVGSLCNLEGIVASYVAYYTTVLPSYKANRRKHLNLSVIVENENLQTDLEIEFDHNRLIDCSFFISGIRNSLLKVDSTRQAFEVLRSRKVERIEYERTQLGLSDFAKDHVGQSYLVVLIKIVEEFHVRLKRSFELAQKQSSKSRSLINGLKGNISFLEVFLNELRKELK